MNVVALITGASRGIGRGIALQIARLGGDLLVNYARNTDAAQQTAADCRTAAREAGHANSRTKIGSLNRLTSAATL